MRELVDSDETVVLLAGDGPDGLSVLRFRRAIWSEGLECYLAELYVKPSQRGRGIGRALLDISPRVSGEPTQLTSELTKRIPQPGTCMKATAFRIGRMERTAQ